MDDEIDEQSEDEEDIELEGQGTANEMGERRRQAIYDHLIANNIQ